MVKSIVMPFNWAFLDLIQVIRPIIKSFRLIGFDYTYHFQLFKNGHRWNILDKITITELIYSVFSGKDPGNCKSLKIGKEKKVKSTDVETNRHQYDQNELVAAWIHKNKHQVALLIRKQYEYAWLEWL